MDMNTHLNRASNLILLLVGLESLCVLIKESFSLLIPSDTYIWLALLCLLLWIASGFRWGILIGMPLSAAVLYYLYHYRTEDLLVELKDLLEQISAAYYGHFSGIIPTNGYESGTGSHMVAVLLIFFLLAAFVSTALTSGSFRVSLVLLATVPLFAVCIAINGKPSIFPSLGIIIFWCGLLMGGEVFRPNDGAGKLFAIGILPCLLVLSGLLLLYRPSTYVPTEQDFNLSQRFDKLGNAFSEWMNKEGSIQQALSGAVLETAAPVNRAPRGWDNGSSELDLTVPFDYSALHVEAFHVSSDASGSLYFRGRSYGEYTGTAWSSAVENNRGQALSYTAQTIAAGFHTDSEHFQLQSRKQYDILYLPYFSISAAGSDVSVPADGRTSYEGDFYLSGTDLNLLGETVSLPQSLRSEELQYLEFVHSYYTRLPDETKTNLSDLCRTLGFEQGRTDTIWRVADYVRSIGEYDINVKPYPSSDYAVYFLTTSHSGYCIHFATAAAALYRCLGIPARVCEGYLVNILSDQTVTVSGTDAHAWVDVYVDHVGWIPVEVTASAAGSTDSPAGTVASTPDEQPTPTPFDEDDESTSFHTGESETPSMETNPEGNNEGNSVDSTANNVSTGLHTLLALLQFVLLVVLLFFGRYAFLRMSLQRNFRTSDNRLQTIHYYRQAERVLRYGGSMPKSLQEIAEKASFSQHDIDSQELQSCSDHLCQLTDEVYSSLPKWKQFFFRFWSGNL